MARIKRIISSVSSCVEKLFTFLWNKICLPFLNFIDLTYLCEKKWVLIRLLVVSCFFLWVIIPSSQPFEGQLKVSKLSFTSTQPNKSFLGIENIKKITIVGKQKILLDGEFSSQDYSELNDLKEIEINLPEQSSQWTLMSSDPKKNGIGRAKLVLQANTKITDIEYNSFSRIISFSLNSNSNSGSKNSSYLIITPNPENKIKISLERYHLPKLFNLNSQDDSVPLEFDFKSTSFKVDLAKSVTLYFEIENSDESIFRSKIPVEDVMFQTVIKTGIENDVIESTIKSGTIRMAKQNLQLKPEQFLIIAPLAISNIRRLKILPDQGLEVQVSGKTKLIQLGLNPQLPVEQISGNRFEQWFSRDFYIAIITLIGLFLLELIKKLE